MRRNRRHVSRMHEFDADVRLPHLDGPLRRRSPNVPLHQQDFEVRRRQLLPQQTAAFDAVCLALAGAQLPEVVVADTQVHRAHSGHFVSYVGGQRTSSRPRSVLKNYHMGRIYGKIHMNSGLELATPVLEQQSPFGNGKQSNHLLHMSMSWLLAGALPPVYSRPIRAHSPNSSGVGRLYFQVKVIFGRVVFILDWFKNKMRYVKLVNRWKIEEIHALSNV